MAPLAPIPSFCLQQNYVPYVVAARKGAASPLVRPVVAFLFDYKLPWHSKLGINPRLRPVRVIAHAAVVQQDAVKFQPSTWTWKSQGKQIKIHSVECKGDAEAPCENLLLLPTISDVSTTEEWQAVASNLVARAGPKQWRAVIVDWPGFGLSDRPPLHYTADLMESFLEEFFTASGLGDFAATFPVVIGGGHAATLAIRALNKGKIKASALVAVAPTWAGPMPIVFGREPEMESRYGLLRNALRAPGVGWAMYNFLVSSPTNIRKQYVSHVYAEPENVTDAIVENRLSLTKREGARFAPAAFLTGLLDPVQSRNEFVSLFANLDRKVSTLVISSRNSPKRSKAEMESLRGAKGVSKYVETKGALLPQEEYPEEISDVIYEFLLSMLENKMQRTI